MLHNFQEAIDDYTRAIDIEPKHIRAYRMRGVSKAGFGNSQCAMADYTKVINLDTQNAYAYKKRGVVSEIKGDREAACQD